GVRITKGRIRVAVAPATDLTKANADLRRVPFMLAHALEQTKRFQVADPSTVQEHLLSQKTRSEELLVSPGKARTSGKTLVVTVAGCGGRGWREYLGLASPSDASIALRAAEPKWLLIRNPRCCDVASEPEYIWVEEDKVPTTVKSFVFGQSALLAPPEIVS